MPIFGKHDGQSGGYKPCSETDLTLPRVYGIHRNSLRS